MKKIACLGIFALLALSSCHDFLNKFPEDVSYIYSASDYEELLIGTGYMDVQTGKDIGGWLQLMDDDVDFKVKDQGGRIADCAFYWWEPAPDTEVTWKALYQRITITNIVINGIDEYKHEGDLYRQVKGESMFLRAANYYFLINIYAQPYRASTATADPGVPLRLDDKVENRKVARASVEEGYAQIINDLKESIQLLKGLDEPVKFRANEAAARMLLSRAYLHTGNWDACTKQCDTVLTLKQYSLQNFNSDTPDGGVSINYDETIFSSGRNNYLSTSLAYYNYGVSSYFKCSEELLGTYTGSDLRTSKFFPPVGINSGIPNKNTANTYSDFFSIRLAEAYLNRAEALVMLGRENEAKADLHALRLKRFTAGTIDDEQIAETGQDLVNYVREERRREFAFEGHRWFDLRRYAVAAKWPMQKQIVHNNYTDSVLDGAYVLDVYDEDYAYYILPLPEGEIVLNGGMLKQNPLRKHKEIVRI